MASKSKGSRRPSRNEPAASTRERLMDVAEALFGERGYEGASVRDIAERARANLGAVTYHFGSKEALFLETFLRRARPVNERRLAELHTLRAAAGPAEALPLREILRCLLRGPVELARTHPEFIGLLTRTILHPPKFAAARLHRELAPLEGPFAGELARSLPHLPKEILCLRLALCGGSLHLLLSSWAPGRVPPLPGPLPALSSDAVLDSLVSFCAAGLSAPATPPPQDPHRPATTKLAGKGRLP